jgi:hypothetical protein
LEEVAAVDIQQRLQEFYRRLDELPPFASHDEAFAEISRVLTEIEDEFSGVPRDPTGMPKKTDGRMYPPVSAYAKQCDLPDVVLYVQTGHQKYIGNNGAVLIVNRRTGIPVMDRPSQDGRRIDL